MSSHYVVGAMLGALVATGASLVVALTSKPLPRADIAWADAHQMLVTSWPEHKCAGHCGVTVLGPVDAGDWRVRLTSPGWLRCYVVTLKRFSWTLERGVTGAVQVPCGKAQEAGRRVR